MQSRCLFRSRVGTAIFRKFARHGRSSAFLCTFPPSITREDSLEDQPSPVNQNPATTDVADQPCSDIATFIPNPCSKPKDYHRHQSAHGFQSLKCNAENVSLGLNSRPDRVLDRETNWRMIWRPQRSSHMQAGEVNTALRLIGNDEDIQDAKLTTLSKTMKQEAKRPGKWQRIKRAKAYIWQQLDQSEKQLELAEVYMDVFMQRVRVATLSKMIEIQLGKVERQLEFWNQVNSIKQHIGLMELRTEASRQQVVITELLKIIDRQLGKVELHMETWRQLDLAVHQSVLLDKDLCIVERLTATLRDPGLAEKREETIRAALQTIKRGVDVWQELLAAEAHLASTCHQSQSVKRRLKNLRRSTEMTAVHMKTTRKRSRRPLSRLQFLTQWLNTSDASEREQYYSEYKGDHRPLSLPLILVAYLRLSANPNTQLDEFDRGLIQASSTVLRQNRCTAQDLAEWAWIVSVQDGKLMTARFVSSKSTKPTFLLLELLKRDDLDVRSLELLLTYSWDRLLGTSRSNLGTESKLEIKSTIPSLITTSLHSNDPAPLSQSSFSAIFTRLLWQARRMWPAAIVSISHMLESFIQLHICNNKKLDRQRHAQLCQLYNRSLRDLSLPSAINPMKSMIYNWQAQRVILRLGTSFEPALLLDQTSYRAVARVLAASKRSEGESKAATLRARSWPPWRVEQDGMDAQRLPEEDLSRVAVTANQAKESGYSEEAEDWVMKVLGGQEPDGTPTIPTRTLSVLSGLGIKKQKGVYRPSGPFIESLPSRYDPQARVWVARIEATRDVQEAWAAFLGYRQRGHQPTMSMYSAMITKLVYEFKRSAGTYQAKAPPGEGRELLAPSNDNYSVFYQSHLQPPSINELYQEMRQAGIRPVGRLLTSLIEHAQTLSKAVIYLVDSGVDSRAVAFLQGQSTQSRLTSHANVLKSVPEKTLAAFIALLCRFAPRIIPSTSDSTPTDGRDDINKDVEASHPLGTGWRLLELGGKDLYPSLLNPLLHSANLLRISQTRYRPAWYAFFKGLVRRRVVINRTLIGSPKNDIVAWKVFVAALGDFHGLGLELDPDGFRLLCIGLQKALRASFQLPEKERERICEKEQLAIVVHEFGKLSEVSKTTQHPAIPHLLHSIGGAQLHEYVRLLGLSKDYDALMYALQWMVRNHVDLDNIALQSRNGPVLLKRTIVALKVFLDGTEHATEAEGLVKSVGTWDGWPDDAISEAYLEDYKAFLGER